MVKHTIIGNILRISGIYGINYKDIPYKIADNEFSVENGMLKLKGSTVNIADFYINGVKVDLLDDGRFYVDDINVENEDAITLQWVTAFGNTITKEISILKNISLENEYRLFIGDKEKLQINLEPSQALMPENMVWSSSNPNVATIDNEGNVDPQSIGETTITVTTKNGKTATCKVIVRKYPVGDVNGDGRVNAGDYVAILNYVRKKIVLTEEQLQRADANGDGKVNAGDYVTILNIVRGKI